MQQDTDLTSYNFSETDYIKQKLSRETIKVFVAIDSKIRISFTMKSNANSPISISWLSSMIILKRFKRDKKGRNKYFLTW